MQPLVDERLQGGIGDHPIGFFSEVERLVGMDGAEDVGMQLLLEAGLRGVGDHHVGVALRQLIEDRQIVGVKDNVRGVEVGSVEALVRAARVGDDSNPGRSMSASVWYLA